MKTEYDVTNGGTKNTQLCASTGDGENHTQHKHEENHISHEKHSVAYCSVSGLSLEWIERTIGFGVECVIPIHPLFQGSNFTKVERIACDRKDCWEIDREVIAALCMYRLVKWEVVDRAPEGKVLNKWVRELAGMLDQGELRNVYKTIIANHSPEMQRIEKFKFRLEGIEKDNKEKSVSRLLYLIGKCRDAQMGIVRNVAIEAAKNEEEMAKIAQEDKEVRIIEGTSSEELGRRVKGILIKYQGKVCEGKGKDVVKKWRYIRELVDGGLDGIREDMREAVMKVIEDKIGKLGNREERLIVEEYMGRIDEKSKDAWDATEVMGEM